MIMQVDNEPLGEDVSHLGSLSTLGGSLLLTSDPGCGQFAEVGIFVGRMGALMGVRAKLTSVCGG